MEIAFRKNDNSFASKLVCWWTGSIYSHCEIVFSNGLTFSAFIEDYETRFKTIEHSTDKYDYIKIPLTREQEYIVYKFCLDEDGCWYDIIGIIFTQVIPLSFENKYWWFCSEICCAGLRRVGILNEIISHQVSPGKLCTLLLERGYKLNE